VVSRARIEIEAMRLMVLKAAKAMDVLGNREARVWVSMVKAMVPERVCQIIDQAIQMHGATGVSQWTPLARCTPASARCGSPTARTRCTTWWSAAPNSAGTRMSPRWRRRSNGRGSRAATRT
jgi:alkylation response protein AidB-like acyl-CoA dehydrogenase